jgi:hypothetical protein
MLSIKSEECFPIFGDIEKRNTELAMTREQRIQIYKCILAPSGRRFNKILKQPKGKYMSAQINTKVIDPKQTIEKPAELEFTAQDGLLHENRASNFDSKKALSFAKGVKFNSTNTNPPTEATEVTETREKGYFSATETPPEVTEALLKQTENDYPANFLPPLIGMMCAELAVSSKVGLTIPAHCGLAYLSLASQRLFNVKHPLSGSTFPTSVNFLTVAKSGERKSGVENILREATNSYEESNKHRYQNELADYQAEKDVHDSEVASLKAVKKPKKDETPPKENSLSSDERKAELKKLYLSAPVRPIPNDMVVRLDATPEGLFRCLSERLSVGMFGDEGIEFFSSHGMQKDGGAQGRSLSQFSYLWDGRNIDRVRAAGHETLKNARVTLHVMIQPKILESFEKELELMNDQGFGARLCIDHAVSKLGEDQNLTPEERADFLAHTNKYSSSLDSVKEFNQVILRILNEPIDRDEKNPEDGLKFRVIELVNPQAREVWLDFQTRVNKENGKNGKYHPISGIAAKSSEVALRFAAQFAIFDAAANKPKVGDLVPEISEENMRCGVGLAEYYLNRRATKFQEDAQDPTRRDLKEIIEWMLKKGKTTLKASDFSRLPYKFQKDAAKTRKAIELGVNEGFMEPTKDLNSRGEPRSWVLTQQAPEAGGCQ